MTTPTALLVGVRPGRHTRTAIARCPYCRRDHHHGWPYSDLTPGTRTAHCGNGPYRITLEGTR